MKTVKNGHKRHIRLDAVLLIIGVVCLSIFAGISYYNAMEEKRSRETVQQLRSMRDVGIAPRVDSSQTDTEKQDAITTSYERLFEANADMIGWLNIPGTQIDYPVMQTVNNEYYLNHNFNQEEDKNGCIFMDYQCDAVNGCDNIILYGHHMQSGKMFGTLNKYSNESYYEAHPRIKFDTIYNKGEYEVMYVFRSKVYSEEEVTFKYYQFINAGSAKEFDSYMNEMAALSLYDTGVTANYGDKLLTLSTCDYQENEGRFVVVAKRVN